MTHPTPNHEHDDLRQPRRTDATPHAEADALDALLNEIAQGSGFPDAPSGSRKERPDVRSDDHEATSDAGDLQAATRSFHRRFEAAEARDSGAVALDPTLWETIMHATTDHPEPVPGDLWRGATRNTVQPVISPPARRWAGSWGGVANATLSLLILLAGFATWQIYDRVNAPGGSDTPPTGAVPSLAMQPGTPDGKGDPLDQAAMTPASAYACDYSADIPIFPIVETVPVEGTALRITPRGELILTCPEEPGGIVLANEITSVSPMFWPGVVQLLGEGRPGVQPVSVLNVFTGDPISLGVPPESATYQWTQPAGSPWLITSAVDKPGDWLIVDLRTMESRLFTEITGTAPLPDGTVLDATSNGSLLALTPWFSEYPGNVGTNPSLVLLDQPVTLVIEGSLTNARTFPLPGDLHLIYETLLSPDGQHLALRSTDADDGETIGKTTYSVVKTTDGTEVGRSATFDDPTSAMQPMTNMRWVQGGAELAYAQGTALMMLPASGGDPAPVLEIDDQLGELQNTGDPDIVVVHVFEEADLASGSQTVASERLYSVNTVTGEAIEIDGFDVSHRTSWVSATQFLVMSDSRIMNMDAETASFSVVDTVTGEIIDEITRIEISQDPNGLAMDLRGVASTRDGAAEVVAFNASQIYLLRDANGTPEVRQLPPPDPTTTSHVGDTVLWISDDGTMLSLTIDSDVSGTRYLLNLDEPDAQWTAVPSPDSPAESGLGPSPIYFVPGTGD